MNKGHGPWREGRRAWERLNGWQDGHAAAKDSETALTALADIGFVRRLLDQAELAAVQAARRQRKSWAEIATNLGVTRQSAWERWRDLDDSSVDAGSSSDADRSSGAALEAATADLVDRATSDRRRRSTVTVPNVIGLTAAAALARLREAGLVPVGSDLDGIPLLESIALTGSVTDQSPESGAKVGAGSTVTLWIGRDGGGGSAGVREPRRPKPDPRSARERTYERSDETTV